MEQAERAEMARTLGEQGWCRTPMPIVPPQTIAAALAGAKALCRGEHRTGTPPQADLGDGVRELRKIDQAWWADDRIAAVSRHCGLGEIAADLLGVDAVHLWHDQLLWKPPASEAAGVVGWHQDRGYWTAVDRAEMITAWVALAPVTPEMGSMRFVNGSHRWGRVIEGNGFFETDAAAQLASATVPEGAEWVEATTALAPGQATFHSCRTVHGSPPNRSTVPRVGIAVHFISSEARRVPGKYHANTTWAKVADGDRWSDEPRIPRVWPVAS